MVTNLTKDLHSAELRIQTLEKGNAEQPRKRNSVGTTTNWLKLLEQEQQISAQLDEQKRFWRAKAEDLEQCAKQQMQAPDPKESEERRKDAEATRKELEDSRARVADLTQQNEKLKAAVSEKEALVSELAKGQEQTTARLEEVVLQLTRQYQSELDEQEETIRAHDQQLQSKDKEMAMLKKQVKEMESELQVYRVVLEQEGREGGVFLSRFFPKGS